MTATPSLLHQDASKGQKGVAPDRRYIHRIAFVGGLPSSDEVDWVRLYVPKYAAAIWTSSREKSAATISAWWSQSPDVSLSVRWVIVVISSVGDRDFEESGQCF